MSDVKQHFEVLSALQLKLSSGTLRQTVLWHVGGHLCFALVSTRAER